MTAPAALLFDLDGTLVDSAITIAMALSELSTSRGGAPADVVAVRRLVSQGAPVLVRETLGFVAEDIDTDLAAFRAILGNLPADPATIYPGVVDALTALSGHPCAVVTNKPQGLARQLLEQLDLAHFFGAVVGGDTLAVCKPDAAPLLHAQAEIKADGRCAVMIGDSAIDAAAARAAGASFALFEGGYGPVDNDPTDVHIRFRDFADLPPLVARHGAAARAEPGT
ncbi:MAG: HAD family hydrolase [Novosphingobium sp.]|nr:MAG: HAD family hydrolase [Novosphingobium sp.]